MNQRLGIPISSKPNRFAWGSALLTAVIATVVAIFSITAAPDESTIALLWYPTALFACLLTTQSVRYWAIISLLAYISILLARLVASPAGLSAVDWQLPVASAAGALTIAWTIRQMVCKPLQLDPALDRDWFFRIDLAAFFRLLAFSFVPGILIPAVIGSVILTTNLGLPALTTFEQWLAGDGLGAVGLLPLAFCAIAAPLKSTLNHMLSLKSLVSLALIMIAVLTYTESNFVLFYTTAILAAAATISSLTSIAALTMVVSLLFGFGINSDLFVNASLRGEDRFLSTYLPLILGLLPGLFIAISRQELDNRLLRTRSMLDQSEQIRAVMTNEMPLFCYVRNLGNEDAVYLTPALKQFVYGDANSPGPYSPNGIFHQEDLATMRNANVRGENEPVPFSFETRIFRSDGGYVWHKVISYPVLDATGAVIQRVGVMQDVDDLHQTQAQLRAQANELTRSNQSLEMFAVAASHDLQEPLRMVSGYTQLLKKRYGAELNEDARSMIDIATDASIRMSQLIQDLLAFSRVPVPDPQDQAKVEAAVDNTNRLLAKTIADHNASIEVAASIPALNLTQSSLNQLMLNLIGNAIRYRSKQAPEIRILLLSETDSHITLSVQDNGIGIEPKHQQEIFEVFKRFNKGSATEKPGNGIGLSLCKRIVDSAGGQIEVRSDGESGTQFRISLKRAGGPIGPLPTALPVTETSSGV